MDLDWNYKIIKLFNQLIIRLLNQCHNIKILKKNMKMRIIKKILFLDLFSECTVLLWQIWKKSDWGSEEKVEEGEEEEEDEEGEEEEGEEEDEEDEDEEGEEEDEEGEEEVEEEEWEEEVEGVEEEEEEWKKEMTKTVP